MRKKQKTAKPSKDLPATLKKHNLRVSAPYGIYPEDVEHLIINLEKSVQLLEKENIKLAELYSKTSDERDRALSELTKLKMQVSLMEIPDTTAEEDFTMLAKLSSVNPIVGNPEIPKPTIEKHVFDEMVTAKQNVKLDKGLLDLKIINSKKENNK